MPHEGRGGRHAEVQPHVAVTKLSMAIACTLPEGVSQPPWWTPSVTLGSDLLSLTALCVYLDLLSLPLLPPAPLSTNSEDAHHGGCLRSTV